MTIQPVRTKADLNHFIKLPYQLYQHDPMWIPPLLSEQRGQFDPKRNPMLDHCEYELFLLKDNDLVIGKVVAFIDKLAVEYWKEAIGLFGYYVCIEDNTASRKLLETAVDWLRTQGMKIMRGPWTFVSQEWGMVVEGFSPPPVIMAPYNPPYYNDHLTAFGLQKVKDLLCYTISGKEGYRIPKRILDHTDAVAKRYGVRVRQVDMKNYEQEVQTVMDLSNKSLSDNWGSFLNITARVWTA